MKHEIQSVKQGITFTQDEVDTLKEKAETNKLMKEMKEGLKELKNKIAALELRVKNKLLSVLEGEDSFIGVSRIISKLN